MPTSAIRAHRCLDHGIAHGRRGSWHVADVSHFDTPASANDWMNLHAIIYELYRGVLSNLSGTTREQEAAGERLRAENLPGAVLLFGR